MSPPKCTTTIGRPQKKKGRHFPGWHQKKEVTDTDTTDDLTCQLSAILVGAQGREVLPKLVSVTIDGESVPFSSLATEDDPLSFPSCEGEDNKEGDYFLINTCLIYEMILFLTHFVQWRGRRVERKEWRMWRKNWRILMIFSCQKQQEVEN